MLFINIGDGYSSGCCTGSRYSTAEDDPQFQGAAPLVEHPASRPGSFVNQLADVYKAKPITFARHRTTIEETLDLLDELKKLLESSGEQKIMFFGMPDLYSIIKDDQYLLLDGLDEVELDDTEYADLCANREQQDLTRKISQIQHYFKQISKLVDKVILYRTTSEPVKLKLPRNVINTNLNIVDKLRETYTPYNRGYFDTRAYSSLKKEFLKLL